MNYLWIIFFDSKVESDVNDSNYLKIEFQFDCYFQ